MRRNWKSLLQDASYQRLGLALVLSFLLHLLLIGKLGFSMPNLNDPPILIEAQLVLPKVTAPVALAKPIIKKQVKVQSSIPKPIPSAAAENPVEPIPSPSLPAEEVQPNSPTETSEVVESQPEDAGVIVNTDAYKYVETEFDVRTDIDSKIDSSPAGRAKITYELQPNNEQYKIKNIIQAKGLASLVIPDLLQTSEGYLSERGLKPTNYLYQFGNKKDKTFSANFDWSNAKLTLNSSKGQTELALPPGTQDLLSFMYQFMFVAPLQEMQLNITNGKKLTEYDYSFEGEKTIQTKMGELHTIHLSHSAIDNDDRTEMWLALDYQYVPVKIRKTSKEGKTYELLVTNLKTQRTEETPK